MTILVLVAALSLKVDPDAGNNKFNATFDAPLGEKINAVSSAVGCDLTYDDKSGNVSGTCSVPLTSIMVDSEPTKTEHFQQWATNKKSDAKSCKIEAKVEGVKVAGPLAAEAQKFAGEAAFTVCGKARDDKGKEKLEGNAMMLPDGRIRVRAHVDKFNRDKYKIGPRYTEGWLSRVQQLAPVVAEEGTIDISIFAKPAETKAATKP
ncbi:MAG TPA: hypothetical protein VF993_04060 [Myxococcales bacterium]